MIFFNSNTKDNKNNSDVAMTDYQSTEIMIYSFFYLMDEPATPKTKKG